LASVVRALAKKMVQVASGYVYHYAFVILVAIALLLAHLWHLDAPQVFGGALYFVFIACFFFERGTVPLKH